MRLVALLLSGCFLGGTSRERVKPEGAVIARDASACAHVESSVVIGTAGPRAQIPVQARLSWDEGELQLDVAAQDSFLMLTVPPLPAGSYAVDLLDADGVAAHCTLTLSVDASCAARYTPSVVATGGLRSVTLSWDTSPVASAYEVLATSKPSEPLAIVATTLGGSHVESSLQDGETRYYKVRLKSAIGDIESPAVSASTIPPRVRQLNLQQSGGALTLTWALSRGAQSYDVEYSSDERSFTLVQSVNSFTLDVQQPGDGVYRVTAINEAGGSVPSVALPFVRRSGDLVRLCQSGPAPSSAGLITLDKRATGNAPAITTQTYDSTHLATPVSGVTVTPDGVAWIGSARGLTAYSASDNESQFLAAPTLRESNGAVRAPTRSGWAFAYDAMLDAFVVLGARPSVPGSVYVLYAIDRFLATEPHTIRERTTSFLHPVDYIAVRSNARELFVVARDGPASAIYVYDADNYEGFPKRQIAGTQTLLTDPSDIAYDALNDDIVVLNGQLILRFSASGGVGPPKWQTSALVEAIAVKDGAIYGLRSAHDGVHVWPTSTINGEPPPRTIPTTPEMSTLVGARLAVDPVSGQLWAAGSRGGAPFAVAFDEEKSIIVAPKLDAASQSSFSSRCVKAGAAIASVAPTGGISFFDASGEDGPVIGSKRWSTLSVGAGSTALTRSIAFSQDEMFVTGANNQSGTYRDFVSAVPIAASGPTVTASRTWLSSSTGADQTMMEVAVEGEKVLLWRHYGGPSIEILPRSLSAPEASVVDAAATGVVALASHAQLGRTYALRSNEVRVYTRAGATLSYQSSITTLPPLSGASDMIVDGDEIFIALETGQVLVVAADASGQVTPLRTMEGNRTGLVAGTGSPRFLH